MAFGAPGPMELVVLLGLAGGVGMPVGIPPGPEDALIAQVAPEECLFYAATSGVATPNPQSTNETEKLLAEPEVQHLVKQVTERIKTAIREAAQRENPAAVPIAENAIKYGEMLLSRPVCVFVSKVSMGPTGPDIRGGAVVNVGEEGAALETALKRYPLVFGVASQPVEIGGDTWQRLQLDPNAPSITWGVKGRYLIVGVGEGSVEGILERAGTAPPKWLADLRAKLPVSKMSTTMYVDLRSILQTTVPLSGDPKVQLALDATGVSGITSLASVTGLDEEAYVSRSLIALDGEPTGVLAALTAGSLTSDDLAVIPADATMALAGKLDASAVLESILAVVQAVEPRGHEEMVQGLTMFEQMFGVDLRGTALKALGDRWCIYNSPGEGGLVITGLTGVVSVKDSKVLADLNQRLVTMVKAQMGDSPRSPRIEQFEFAGRQVYFFNARDDDFPLAPAWCLTDDALIVAPFPQNIKAHLGRGDDFHSIATVPEMAAAVPVDGGPIAVSYTDTRALFDLVYPLVPMIAQVAFSELQREGIDLDVSIVPSAKSIGKHLRPSVASVRRTEAGIEIVSHQTIPLGGALNALPTAMFSFVGVARTVEVRERAHAVREEVHSHGNGVEHAHDHAVPELVPAQP